MTDTLIARLRKTWNPSPDLMLEAADRIEALQAELTEETMRGLMLEKSHEALRAEVKAAQQLAQLNGEIAAELKGERDQLRAEVERLTKQCRLFEAAAYKAKVEAQTLVEDIQARLTALEGQKPEFWWRPFDDGSYLGPIHDDSIEEVRKLSQEWKPLYLAPGAAPQQAEPKEQT